MLLKAAGSRREPGEAREPERDLRVAVQTRLGHDQRADNFAIGHSCACSSSSAARRSITAEGSANGLRHVGGRASGMENVCQGPPLVLVLLRSHRDDELRVGTDALAVRPWGPHLRLRRLPGVQQRLHCARSWIHDAGRAHRPHGEIRRRVQDCVEHRHFRGGVETSAPRWAVRSAAVDGQSGCGHRVFRGSLATDGWAFLGGRAARDLPQQLQDGAPWAIGGVLSSRDSPLGGGRRRLSEDVQRLV
mmetsp:Transcript_64446/g.185219  ORF Transcript_64446/g.185219 Transcript_64446/m.185219 type:complete len:247 (-) Transcript_64446:38-778(-)